jgi:hypothetical protein
MLITSELTLIAYRRIAPIAIRKMAVAMVTIASIPAALAAICMAAYAEGVEGAAVP